MAAATAREKVIQYVAEYNSQLDKLKNRISEASQRLEDIQLEINFLQQKEIPEAVERRVLTLDKSQELKARKSLEKLQTEQMELSEEVMVLDSVLKKFIIDWDDNVRELYSLFRTEKEQAALKVYKSILKHKKVYEDAIQKEAKPLHDWAEIDKGIQQIAYNAGRTSTIYSAIGPGRYDNVNLQITQKEAIAHMYRNV